MIRLDNKGPIFDGASCAVRDEDMGLDQIKFGGIR